MLPSASSAKREVTASRSHPYRSRFLQGYHTPLGIVFFLFDKLYINNVARCTIRYKNHHIVHSGQRIAFSSHIGYLNMFQYRKLLTFS